MCKKEIKIKIMIPLPNLGASLVDKLGKILAPWNSYLQQFTQAPPDVVAIVVGVSPFTYIVKEPGTLVISGGTVSIINLGRGTTTILVANSTALTRFIPVGIKDVVAVSYTVLPTIQFIPAYGQNTGS